VRAHSAKKILYADPSRDPKLNDPYHMNNNIFPFPVHRRSVDARTFNRQKDGSPIKNTQNDYEDLEESIQELPVQRKHIISRMRDRRKNYDSTEESSQHSSFRRNVPPFNSDYNTEESLQLPPFRRNIPFTSDNRSYSANSISDPPYTNLDHMNEHLSTSNSDHRSLNRNSIVDTELSSVYHDNDHFPQLLSSRKNMNDRENSQSMRDESDRYDQELIREDPSSPYKLNIPTINSQYIEQEWIDPISRNHDTNLNNASSYPYKESFPKLDFSIPYHKKIIPQDQDRTVLEFNDTGPQQNLKLNQMVPYQFRRRFNDRSSLPHVQSQDKQSLSQEQSTTSATDSLSTISKMENASSMLHQQSDMYTPKMNPLSKLSTRRSLLKMIKDDSLSIKDKNSNVPYYELYTRDSPSLSQDRTRMMGTNNDVQHQSTVPDTNQLRKDQNGGHGKDDYLKYLAKMINAQRLIKKENALDVTNQISRTNSSHSSVRPFKKENQRRGSDRENQTTEGNDDHFYTDYYTAQDAQELKNSSSVTNSENHTRVGNDDHFYTDQNTAQHAQELKNSSSVTNRSEGSFIEDFSLGSYENRQSDYSFHKGGEAYAQPQQLVKDYSLSRNVYGGQHLHNDKEKYKKHLVSRIRTLKMLIDTIRAKKNRMKENKNFGSEKLTQDSQSHRQTLRREPMEMNKSILNPHSLFDEIRQVPYQTQHESSLDRVPQLQDDEFNYVPDLVEHKILFDQRHQASSELSEPNDRVSPHVSHDLVNNSDLPQDMDRENLLLQDGRESKYSNLSSNREKYDPKKNIKDRYFAHDHVMNNDLFQFDNEWSQMDSHNTYALKNKFTGNRYRDLHPFNDVMEGDDDDDDEVHRVENEHIEDEHHSPQLSRKKVKEKQQYEDDELTAEDHNFMKHPLQNGSLVDNHQNMNLLNDQTMDNHQNLHPLENELMNHHLPDSNQSENGATDDQRDAPEGENRSMNDHLNTGSSEHIVLENQQNKSSLSDQLMTDHHSNVYLSENEVIDSYGDPGDPNTSKNELDHFQVVHPLENELMDHFEGAQPFENEVIENEKHPPSLKNELMGYILEDDSTQDSPTQESKGKSTILDVQSLNDSHTFKDNLSKKKTVSNNTKIQGDTDFIGNYFHGQSIADTLKDHRSLLPDNEAKNHLPLSKNDPTTINENDIQSQRTLSKNDRFALENQEIPNLPRPERNYHLNSSRPFFNNDQIEIEEGIPEKQMDHKRLGNMTSHTTNYTTMNHHDQLIFLINETDISNTHSIPPRIHSTSWDDNEENEEEVDEEMEEIIFSVRSLSKEFRNSKEDRVPTEIVPTKKPRGIIYLADVSASTRQDKQILNSRTNENTDEKERYCEWDEHASDGNLIQSAKNNRAKKVQSCLHESLITEIDQCADSNHYKTYRWIERSADHPHVQEEYMEHKDNLPHCASDQIETGSFVPRDGQRGFYCCSDDDTNQECQPYFKIVDDKPVCSENVSYDDAHQSCQQSGSHLCTKTELRSKNNGCCYHMEGNPCKYKEIWTQDQPDELMLVNILRASDMCMCTLLPKQISCFQQHCPLEGEQLSSNDNNDKKSSPSKKITNQSDMTLRCHYLQARHKCKEILPHANVDCNTMFQHDVGMPYREDENQFKRRSIPASFLEMFKKNHDHLSRRYNNYTDANTADLVTITFANNNYAPPEPHPQIPSAERTKEAMEQLIFQQREKASGKNGTKYDKPKKMKESKAHDASEKIKNKIIPEHAIPLHLNQRVGITLPLLQLSLYRFAHFGLRYGLQIITMIAGLIALILWYILNDSLPDPPVSEKKKSNNEYHHQTNINTSPILRTKYRKENNNTPKSNRQVRLPITVKQQKGNSPRLKQPRTRQQRLKAMWKSIFGAEKNDDGSLFLIKSDSNCSSRATSKNCTPHRKKRSGGVTFSPCTKENIQEESLLQRIKNEYLARKLRNLTDSTTIENEQSDGNSKQVDLCDHPLPSHDLPLQKNNVEEKKCTDREQYDHLPSKNKFDHCPPIPSSLSVLYASMTTDEEWETDDEYEEQDIRSGILNLEYGEYRDSMDGIIPADTQRL